MPSFNDADRPDPSRVRGWFARLKQRDPALHARMQKLVTARMGPAAALGAQAEGVGDLLGVTLEAIVREVGRPALLISQGAIMRPTEADEESRDVIDGLMAGVAALAPVIPLVGRIDVSNFPGGAPYVGTGWLVAPDIVVTNRHVAELIARRDGAAYKFKPGRFGQTIGARVDYLREADNDQVQAVDVERVIWIEPDAAKADIAFLKVKRRSDGAQQDRIALASSDAVPGTGVAVIGYPARASSDAIPDQTNMDRIYGGRYDVKRIAPGLMDDPNRGWSTHDCTTLGGNSGSVVVDIKTGSAVALHFAGLYMIENYAVPASTIADYIRRAPWQGSGAPSAPSSAPAVPAPERAPPAAPAATSTGASTVSTTVTLNVPLVITVTLGGQVTATVQAGGGGRPAAPDVEAATVAFWEQRPQGVVAARVGYLDDGDQIGDTPCIAAAVPAEQLPAVEAAGPHTFQGFAVRYLPANVGEQIAAMPLVESVDSISYDDEARTGDKFSFAAVGDEDMTVRAHVGPEYSWQELETFLGEGSGGSLVSAIYEFHAKHIKDAIQARLEDGTALKLVMDNVSFSPVKDGDEEFDRRKIFNGWAKRFGKRFERIVVPEGRQGLISDAYHIKVTVRDDDTFWLSSGNWKAGSSQPPITEAERDAASAAGKDLPGNREWHVVIANKTLADRFRAHIEQDFDTSVELGGGPEPIAKEAVDILVDVPIEEVPILLERRAPERFLEPRTFKGKIRVKPLLTPDRKGAVYSEAVLSLIRSARKSLLFQIPYIGMPSNPKEHRGFIDDLIAALTGKLVELPDARVLLRTGGSKLSDPAHAAWFFKSKGVDIENRLRRIDDHHTKGMVVDGKRVLIGSHNWSKPGVSLNRDASLIFDNADIAGYFAQAFEIDWDRSNPIAPKRFVKQPAVVREAVGAAPPPGFERKRLSEVLKEED